MQTSNIRTELYIFMFAAAHIATPHGASAARGQST